MLQLFGFYSLDYFRGGAQQNAKHNDKQEKELIIVDEQLVSNYPVFFEPKWKIFLKNVSKEPTLRELAMLNHLAYGYFYERDDEGDMGCVLSCNENKNQHLLRSVMPV